MSWINEMGRAPSPSSSSSSFTSCVVDPKVPSSLGVSRTLSSTSVDLDTSVQNLIDKMQNGLKVAVNWITSYCFISCIYFAHHWRLNSVFTNRIVWLSETRTVAIVQWLYRASSSLLTFYYATFFPSTMCSLLNYYQISVVLYCIYLTIKDLLHSNLTFEVNSFIF